MATTPTENTSDTATGTVATVDQVGIPQSDHDRLGNRESENQPTLSTQVSEEERLDDTKESAVTETAESSGPSANSAAKVAASSSSPTDSPHAEPESDSREDSKDPVGEDGASSSQAPGELQPQLPNEPLPETEDDGWTYQWDPTHQAYYFLNRFTGQTTWENPRQTVAVASSSTADPTPVPPPLPTVAGGYNPAIHGDYDDWVAEQKKAGQLPGDGDAAENVHPPDPATAALFASGAQFNRLTGQYQRPGVGPENHSDDAKSRRQMNAFFDVDAAANSHDGRSLKAERAGKRLTKGELKHFKEKRKARKEEKRRAWLRD
ncbi:hypothetical protein MCOR27_010188 [Pyricularia oryzae]|uniref:WW domain-containing protein n=5 Tax=Pyricularia TaxID=48558 RepID=A0ABQ8NUY2_PYRGI|nr:WW domain-containing protein [Pyricularia oryzae 70-15]ELQ42174.1 WW domain-containing protein [Pyricularia oryzae Y34]KAH8837243.1 hypothetical protein MCOR01_010879 [Pyricularia oryzae]KAI6301979.1 hypothetical protein MCOR33_002601 [Pyricularia grisea]EHA54031.1 WW domain-containing protein [Pyricularia oryzae 70-15]KAH9438091.1 hypothetical protein MCOR02_001732 [Pyricularia oryzae]